MEKKFFNMFKMFRKMTFYMEDKKVKIPLSPYK